MSNDLYTLFTPLSKLKGVGEAVEKSLRQILPMIGGDDGALKPLTLRDLLLHMPVNLVDRREITPVNQAEAGKEQVFFVRVLEHAPSPPRHVTRGRRVPYRIVTEDETGILMLTFFTAKPAYLTRMFPVGEARFISGKPVFYDGRPTISHPSQVVDEGKSADIRRVHAIYPASQNFGSKSIARIIKSALQLPVQIPEWIEAKKLKQLHWPSMWQALQAIHHPKNMEALQPDSPHRARLAYDELLAHQYMLQHMRHHAQSLQLRHPIILTKPGFVKEASAALPFTLTGDQQQCLREILTDMAGEKPMARMVQGDVGSGKTIVAFLAMLACAKMGKQALLMAPTDLLARQHMQGLEGLAEHFGVKMLLLTGKMPAAAKRKAKAALMSGDAQMAVGTHALFQDDVAFHDLALAVIDEQHRFGVNQRKKLLEKAENPHLLHMSATPIPRSLSMTLYGDLDISLIKERPPGRKPIDTRVMPIDKANDVARGLTRIIEKGERAYWVCPLITPSDDEENKPSKADESLAAAEERFKQLEKTLPGQVGLVHGKMPVKQREEVMQRFVAGEISVLVATTVIEVGVNVPEATVMVVEQAERFGLAQLHQLRGRVGRSALASSCLLLYGQKLSDISKKRLGALKASNDGFELAEEDLRLRGSGDVLGTRQTGLPEFLFADILQDQQILRMAREDAKTLLKSGGLLPKPEQTAIHHLLQLFGYEPGNMAGRVA